MKNKFFKIITLICTVALLCGALAACGQSAANDASDEWGSVSWSYTKSNGTLIIVGSEAVPTAASSEAVGWASVRDSVKKVIVTSKDDKPITSIGDYAFYGMSQLTEVSLPKDIKSIGKCAFAFCTSLQKLDVPAGLESLGEGAFEGCTKLTSIRLPVTASSIGDRAFAYCRELGIVLIEGQPAQIGKWTFKDCSKLSTVAIGNKDTVAFAEEAFEGAAIGADKVSVYSQDVYVTVYYRDSETKELIGPQKITEQKKYGDSYSYTAPAIEGYIIPSEHSILQGQLGGQDLELEFLYTKGAIPVETDSAPAETPPAEKNPVGTIIALVIFGVAILGIVIGVVLFVRSDKKQKKNGTTVRKSDKDTSGKKGNQKKSDKDRYRRK